MPSKQRKQVRAPTEQSHYTRRQAVTLVEVLLVLVVLTLIAATAWPSLERSFANQRLRDAADMVRAELASARAEAMRSGAAQQFHYALDEQTYWVEPCKDGTGSTDESSTSTNVPTGSETNDHSILPDDIFFHEGESQQENSPDASADGEIGNEQLDPHAIEDGEAGAPIVFYPDGTCTSARLVLRNQYDRGITVTIRGLTGMSDTQEIFNLEDRL